MIKRASASMGCLSPVFCLTTLLFSSTPRSGSTRWHIMEYLTDCESLYCFSCHLSCIHNQSGHCTECCYPSVQRSIWHFALPLHYFNIPSPPHNPITVKSLLCGPQCLMVSFFSLTMSWQWNETHCGLRRKGWKWRTLGETGREAEKNQTKDERGGGQSRRVSKKRENWDIRVLSLKGRLRNLKYISEENRQMRCERSRKERLRCFLPGKEMWLCSSITSPLCLEGCSFQPIAEVYRASFLAPDLRC